MKRIDSSPLRVGVIGTGRIVERVHLPLLNRMSDVVVLGLFDPEQDRAMALAHYYGIPNACSILDELFDLNLDVALIACPNHLHAATSIAALEAGVHVLCEKPMATSVGEAITMIEAVERTGQELMIAFTNRFHPDVIALQEAVKDGQFGEIIGIRCGWLRHKGIPGIRTWFTRRALAGGGSLTDLGSHLIDLALWLSGQRHLLTACCVVDQIVDPQSQASWYLPTTTAIGDVCDVEISASGFAIFDGPLDLFIEVSWACAVPNDRTYMHVIGKRGVAQLETLFGLSLDGNRPKHPLHVWIDGQSAPLEVVDAVDVLQPYRNQWDFFIDSLRQGRSLSQRLRDNLLTVQVIETMYELARGLHRASLQ